MRIINEERKKKKNKFTFGWFTTLNLGDPEKNKEIFNKNTTYNFPDDNVETSESDTEASGAASSDGDNGATTGSGIGENLNKNKNFSIYKADRR